ncbi:hypothetical protein [Paenibacillus alginolyticus]|uniref:Uncharacterized protein n=1 Tax=Paenibacillus alginolyticus TaxID=59839 RepID=A0ABT4G7C5_9BACL|nr:hypothetical protein [Paenibacillus alginolyticus]MCY9692085.1 hypothetical protein [Paenibacillus alginolyticus]MEC0147850.1 hypothetical protein [Paenibacillus alginolyticus]
MFYIVNETISPPLAHFNDENHHYSTEIGLYGQFPHHLRMFYIVNESISPPIAHFNDENHHYSTEIGLHGQFPSQLSMFYIANESISHHSHTLAMIIITTARKSDLLTISLGRQKKPPA